MLRKRLQRADGFCGIDAIEFADHRVFIREKLIKRADRHFGAAGNLVESERFKADVDKHAARGLQDAVKTLPATRLRRPTPRHQNL